MMQRPRFLVAATPSARPATRSGEATLVLELRDSVSNALLGRVLDRRETRGLPGASNSVSSAPEYRQLAAQWAGISVKGLNKLRSHSPLPDPLTPGQKLNRTFACLLR